jgi:Domain of unknown function DUF488
MEDSIPTIYTIGHGRHPTDYFLDLLRLSEIAFVCDVRSAARSRWPQYNGPVLADVLGQHGIGYEHLPECGGKVIAPLAELARGLDRVMELAAELRLVMMCSESGAPHKAYAQAARELPSRWPAGAAAANARRTDHPYSPRRENDGIRRVGRAFYLVEVHLVYAVWLKSMR